MKKDETQTETLERLAGESREGVEAASRFKKLVKRAAETPSPTTTSTPETATEG